MLRDSEDRLDHLKNAVSYTSLELNMKSRTQPSIASSTPNSAAPNEVDRKIPSRQASVSKSRETNIVDGQLTPPDTILTTHPNSREDPPDEQLPTIMSYVNMPGKDIYHWLILIRIQFPGTSSLHKF
jgi:hypothetical protein